MYHSHYFFLPKIPSILAVATCQCGQGCFATGRIGERRPDLVVVEVVGLLDVFSVFVDGFAVGKTACMRTTHALRQDWRFRTGYGLLQGLIIA